MEYHIRDAQENDMGAIQAIYAYHVLHSTGTFEEEPPSLDEMIHRRTTVLSHGLPYLVAEAEDNVIGYSYASPYRMRSAYRFTIENAIYVAPNLDRIGIGSALLSELIATCEKGKWHEMIAVIGDSNNEASIALHNRFGFRTVGTLQNVGLKFGRWIDTVLMQRSLKVK